MGDGITLAITMSTLKDTPGPRKLSSGNFSLRSIAALTYL